MTQNKFFIQTCYYMCIPTFSNVLDILNGMAYDVYAQNYLDGQCKSVSMYIFLQSINTA